uniref:Myosin, light chain kinase 5 n=1 Tax=Sinocyclocheilus anshuiensis TaxID=1608454 RepID=A0A671MTF5_9TELE
MLEELLIECDCVGFSYCFKFKNCFEFKVSESHCVLQRLGVYKASVFSGIISLAAKPIDILQELSNVETINGGEALFECSLSRPETKDCRWLIDGKPVKESAKVEIVSFESGRRHLLLLKDLHPCENTRVTFQAAVPDPPEDPELVCKGPTFVTLSWFTPLSDGGSPIIGYRVEMRLVDSVLWLPCHTEPVCNTEFLVENLIPGAGYRFRVAAINRAGIGEPVQLPQTVTLGEPQWEVTSYVEVVPDTTHKARDHYHVHEKLGVGKFGEVYRMSHKQTGWVCAGKFYRARVSREKTAARQEIKLMKQLHHPKLVQCLAAYDTPSEIVMILEYIAGGELFERIVDENFEHTEPNSVNYMRQILEGIQYIHSKRIVHLDLKPENIVCVNSAGTLIKIIDFGLASKLEAGKHLMVLHGTPEFVAPEVVNYEPVDLATDMWSIGVICYILLSGESPFQGNSDAETLALVTAAQWEFNPESFDGITDEAKDFISGLLREDKRLSCEKALAHPWIALFDDSNSRSTKSLNKDKMRRFLARQKWKKAVTHYFCNSVGLPSYDVPAISANALGKEAEQAVASLEKQLWSEPRFHRALHDLTESCGATVHLACTIQGTVLLSVWQKSIFHVFENR